MPHDRDTLIERLMQLAADALAADEPLIASALCGVAGAIAGGTEASLAAVVSEYAKAELRRQAEQN